MGWQRSDSGYNRSKIRERKTIFTRGNVSGSYEHHVCIKPLVLEDAVCCLQTNRDTVTTCYAISLSLSLLRGTSFKIILHVAPNYLVRSLRIADGALRAMVGTELPRR